MATSGQKELKTKYPVEEGLTARTTKQEGRKMDLEYTESFVSSKDKEGMT